MKNFWYAAVLSGELKDKPMTCKILDEPVVLFRDAEGKANALTDRCPHRNVMLSKGKVVGGNLQCSYHGWEFNGKGNCVFIPSLCQDEKIPDTAVTPHYPVIEQDDMVWVWSGDRLPLENEIPFKIPHYNESGWEHTWVQTTIKNSVDNVIENFIDCSHTGYIHGGLFRTPASHMARTNVKRISSGIVIDIDEETNNRDSFFAKVLLGKDAKITHQDQFILPSIVKVDYGIGKNKNIIGYQICIPSEDFITKVYVCVTWKMGWLTGLIKPIVTFMGNRVLGQDIWILENQAAVIRKYGEHFVSTPADTANNWIKVSRQNARQGIEPSSEKERNVNFRL
jgi:phenylpropionate dioxygenase-like ring-hydroxylating dioxygenase large terminal subunit